MNEKSKANDEGDPEAGAVAGGPGDGPEAPVGAEPPDEPDEGDAPEGGVVREDAPLAEEERASVPPALPPRAALPLALAVTIALAVVLRFAFNAEQAGTWTMLLALFGAYLPLAVLALVLIQKEGRIAAEVRPRGGDLTFGAFVAALMYGAAMAGRQLFLGVESPRNWWVARIYLQLGDLSGNRMLYVGGAVLVIAVLEEIVWRGLVMRSLRRPLGPLRAWLLSSVLYAVAHVATIRLLSHPVAGPNPMLIAASLGCGLVWGHLYNRTGRLTPCLFAHGLFSWAIVDFPLWRM